MISQDKTDKSMKVTKLITTKNKLIYKFYKQNIDYVPKYGLSSS